MLNMFVGVVVENFHRCREEQEKEEKARRAAKRAKKLEKKRRSKCRILKTYKTFNFSKTYKIYTYLFQWIRNIICILYAYCFFCACMHVSISESVKGICIA